jgi:hypothetical protein
LKVGFEHRPFKGPEERRRNDKGQMKTEVRREVDDRGVGHSESGTGHSERG